MFREPLPMKLEDTLTSQEVLELCPWLWAVNHIWAEGFCCETGSVHNLTTEMLEQTLDRMDDGFDIIIYSVQHRIHQVCKERKDNRGVEGEGVTIAERIIATIGPGIYWPSQDLTIPTIVVASPGPVDRTTHYHIYYHAHGEKDLLPLILEAGNGFRPRSWHQQSQSHEAVS